MIRFLVLRSAAVLLLAVSSISAEILYLPAAAHAPGVGGVLWRTDLEILAVGEIPTSLRIDLLERDRDNSSPRAVVVNVPAGRANRYPDALGALFSFEGAAALGAREPWSVVPYAIWRPSELFVRDEAGHSCGEVGGVAVDPAGHRLFAIEKGIGENNSAVVHVWKF